MRPYLHPLFPRSGIQLPFYPSWVVAGHGFKQRKYLPSAQIEHSITLLAIRGEDNTFPAPNLGEARDENVTVYDLIGNEIDGSCLVVGPREIIEILEAMSISICDTLSGCTIVRETELAPCNRIRNLPSLYELPNYVEAQHDIQLYPSQ